MQDTPAHQNERSNHTIHRPTHTQIKRMTRN